MIVKERDARHHPDHDPIALAGAKAEEQMAFYLRRAFERDPNILVFNDLRIASDAGHDYAQLDHLIVFARGMIIIESKSVSTGVRINARGEWLRRWHGEWKGMASPIQQAKLQAEFLRKLLQSHRETLRSKMLMGMLQQGFGLMPIDWLIAISDDGSVDREGDYPEVLKADQVIDRAKQMVAERDIGFVRWALSPKKDQEHWDTLNPDELDRLKNFLLKRHAPLRTVESVTKVAVPEAKAESPAGKPCAATPACEHCQSQRIRVEYGFNYYLKCQDCAKNTAIALECPQCKKKARIRKQKLRYFKECECGFKALYHTNGA